MPEQDKAYIKKNLNVLGLSGSYASRLCVRLIIVVAVVSFCSFHFISIQYKRTILDE